MSTRVILEAHVRPEALEELKGGLEATVTGTREFDGCLELTANVDQDDPCHLVFLGRWQSREHYEKYLEAGRAAGAVEQFEAALTEPLSIRYFDDLGH